MPKTRHKARSDVALFQCETVAHAGDVWSFLFMDSRVRAVSMLSSQARRRESGEPLMPSVIPYARRFGKRKCPLAAGRRLRHGNGWVGVGWMVMLCLFPGRGRPNGSWSKLRSSRGNGCNSTKTEADGREPDADAWSIFAHTGQFLRTSSPPPQAVLLRRRPAFWSVLAPRCLLPAPLRRRSAPGPKKARSLPRSLEALRSLARRRKERAWRARPFRERPSCSRSSQVPSVRRHPQKMRKIGCPAPTAARRPPTRRASCHSRRAPTSTNVQPAATGGLRFLHHECPGNMAKQRSI